MEEKQPGPFMGLPEINQKKLERLRDEIVHSNIMHPTHRDVMRILAPISQNQAYKYLRALKK